MVKEEHDKMNLKRKKNLDPPNPDGLEFANSGTRAIYEHLINLYGRVGNLEGTQKVMLALMLAVMGAIISVAVKVWGG